MKNIVEIIRRETKNYAGKLAFIDKGRTITYAGLFAKIDTAGKELKKFHVKKGARVALLCEDSIDYVILTLAVLKLSAVIVPVPFSSSREEITELIKKMKINFCVFEEKIYDSDKAEPLDSVFGKDKKFFIAPAVPEAASPQNFLKVNPAFIRFSSGTTGTSKGVVISHDAMAKRTDAADKGLKISRNDTILWVLSMSFHFVVTIILFLRRAATIILAGNSFPDGLLAALSRYKPTFIYASPLHYNLMTRLESVSTKQLSEVRMAVSTAIELSPGIAADFHAKFGFELSQAYGIIEVGLPFVNMSHDISKRNSVGKILPDYKIKIVNHDSGQGGEIYLKGKGFFSAYFSPWKNTRTIFKKGWFNTGDIGWIDNDGFLFILGRAKNVINFNGMKIFPFEVEATLNRHPAVQESLVYPVPHPEYGNFPAADIVINKKYINRFCEQDLRAFCYNHLAHYKVPKEFHYVNSIEKTLSGKLKR